MRTKFCFFLFLLAATSINAQPPAPEEGFKWELVKELSDEFNGSTLDTDKWFNANPKRWRGRASGLFMAGVLTVKDGENENNS